MDEVRAFSRVFGAASTVQYTRVGFIMVLRALRHSRHAAVVATLLALFSGQWALCPCSASARHNAKSEHAGTTVQDPHACCETDGFRAGSTCCSDGSLITAPALVTESVDAAAALAPAPTAFSTTYVSGPQATHTPVLIASPLFHPRLSILRI